MASQETKSPFIWVDGGVLGHGGRRPFLIFNERREEAGPLGSRPLPEPGYSGRGAIGGLGGGGSAGWGERRLRSGAIPNSTSTSLWPP